MSPTTVILAAAFGCVVLLAVWVQSGDEATPPLDAPVRNVRPLDAKPFPRAQRPRSMAERSQPRGDTTADTRDDAAVIDDGGAPDPVVKRRPDSPGSTMEERRALRRSQRESRLEAKRQMPDAGRHAGVVPQGQLSRKEPEPDAMGKREQPPLRQPADDFDEDSLEHLSDVALSDPDPDERADALSRLDLDEPGAMDVLIKALDDNDTDVRLAALEEIWTNSDDPPLNILASVIKDTDPEVRLEAVRILAESDEPYAQQLLRGALADTNEDVRDEAADALDVDLD
jgi:hypothetical protein